MAKSLNWKLWIGLLISALFTYLAFRNADLARMWAVMRSADPLFLLSIVAITFFQFVIRAWRWDILLESIRRTSFSSRLSSILIGFAANCVLPARLGEFIRANFMGQIEGISRSSAFGTIVIERLFDGFTLLLVLLIGLMVTTFPLQWQAYAGGLRATGLFLFSVYILFALFLMGFKYKAKPFLKFLDRLLFFLPRHIRGKVIDVIWHFSRGLVLLRSPVQWVQAVFYSFLLWFSSLCQIHLAGHSIGLSLPFMATFLILGTASFGVMIPSAPGFIGTFHLAVQYGFLFYGIGNEEALSAAILWHAAMVPPTILFGLVALLRLHLPVGKLVEGSSISKGEGRDIQAP